MNRLIHLIGGCALFLPLAVLPAQAGESVVLGTGYRLHADRHETADGVIRLYDGPGVTEMPVGLVAGFEPDPAVPLPPATAAPLTIPQEPVAVSPIQMASAAAQKFSLPESFVSSVMRTESGFRPDAVSPKGALGLMQLMPATARDLGVDPRNPRENAEGGAAYLRQLLALYENRPDQVLLALAAYNAGPAAVERWHGVPPYPETRAYILRVLKSWDLKQQESKKGAESAPRP